MARNPYPNSSTFYDIWRDGYVTADVIAVMESNCKPVRDSLREVDGPIKCSHVRRAMAVALEGPVS